MSLSTVFVSLSQFVLSFGGISAMRRGLLCVFKCVINPSCSNVGLDIENPIETFLLVRRLVWISNPGTANKIRMSKTVPVNRSCVLLVMLAFSLVEVTGSVGSCC